MALNHISSDAFCLNIFYVLYDLCAPFLSLSDPKQLWKKIDPTYLASGVRVDFSGETMICSDKGMK